MEKNGEYSFRGGGSVLKIWKVMRLGICFLLLATFTVSAKSVAQQRRVTVEIEEASLVDIIKELRRVSDYQFLYRVDELEKCGKRDLKVKDAEVGEVMRRLLEGTGLTWRMEDEVILIKGDEGKEGVALQQVPKRTIRGMVKDRNGETLPGVSVLVKGTSAGVATDINGRFELVVNDEPDLTITFSFIGMKSQDWKVGNKADITVIMQPDFENLEEVIVTGYQTLSKERATGSFAVVTPRKIENKLQTNILDRLEGQVAGLVQYKGDVSIRGISTVYGNDTPLYVVDGMPYEGNISAINPNDIQNVTVLKDATAASIYGARAANGVIVITTKSGSEGKTKINYNGSVAFQPLPDVGYLKLMNSAELIDLKKELFDIYHADYSALNKRTALDEVTELFYEAEVGNISPSELETKLNVYRKLDRRQQVEDELLRLHLTHQHNLALSGGSDCYTYMASVNFLGTKPYERAKENNQFGFNIKNRLKFFEWFTADVGFSGTFTMDKGDNGLVGISLLQSGPSYQMLKNEDGIPVVWRQERSEYEIERLKSKGMYDLTYRPLDELSKSYYKNKSAYYRVNLGMRFNVIDGLDVHLTYQTENSNYRNLSYKDGDSYSVRDMVVNAAQVDAGTGAITYNVPEGNQVTEVRGDKRAYTMRGQVNFNRTFNGKHNLVALLGGERRAIKSTSSSAFRMGYDYSTLGYKPANIKDLGTGLKGTESLSGTYSWQDKNYNKFTESEDRYIAFYGNASYIYDERYALTGSIRVDQSNLFGTDPKYQWKPLWSLGSSWFMSKESFLADVDWLERLALRFTYGINGNVAKRNSPFMTIQDMGYSDWKQGFSSSVKTPPNPSLRWEKTAVTNVGVDFSFLKGRLEGSFDYYHRKSTDLLGDIKVDITTGWTTIQLNYGSMKNSGIELSLNSINVQTDNFQWRTNLNFSYNKNEIVELTNKTRTAWNYVNSTVNDAGKPMYSLYSYRWAGLNPENGDPQVYNKNDEVVASSNEIEDLVWSGTTRPPYTGSMTNVLSWKGLSLSFMLIYNGGHVIRDAVANYLGSSVSSNIYRGSLNYWKKTGDENVPGMAPAPNRLANANKQHLWYAADIHILKADYIKLRDITLCYSLPKAMLQKLHLDGVSIKAQAQNIWWWAANDSGIDPEAYAFSTNTRGARTLPEAPSYTIGLSLNF